MALKSAMKLEAVLFRWKSQTECIKREMMALVAFSRRQRHKEFTLLPDDASSRVRPGA
jgi:hypothetical protein